MEDAAFEQRNSAGAVGALSGHPNLLESRFDGPGALEAWVRKPLLGREGANIAMHRPDGDFETDGAYGEEGFVYQDLACIASFDGKYPVMGSWLIGHAAGQRRGRHRHSRVGHADYGPISASSYRTCSIRPVANAVRGTGKDVARAGSRLVSTLLGSGARLIFYTVTAEVIRCERLSIFK